MAADFTKPDLTDLHTAIWPQVRDNIDAVAKCFSGSTPATNIPTDAKRFDSGKWQTWNGTAWVDTLISVAGGGTGANSATGARTAIDVYSKGETDGKYLAKASNLLDVANAATARANLGADNASNLTTGTVSAARLPLGTTGAVGAVQLNTSIDSTSTTQAATPSTVKSLNDKISDISRSYQLYLSAGSADILWAEFIGAGSGVGQLVINFIDPAYTSVTITGAISSALSGIPDAIHYASLFTARLSSVNYEYRIKLLYSSYQNKKITVEKFNMSTGTSTTLYMSGIFAIGGGITLISTGV